MAKKLLELAEVLAASGKADTGSMQICLFRAASGAKLRLLILARSCLKPSWTTHYLMTLTKLSLSLTSGALVSSYIRWASVVTSVAFGCPASSSQWTSNSILIFSWVITPFHSYLVHVAQMRWPASPHYGEPVTIIIFQSPGPSDYLTHAKPMRFSPYLVASLAQRQSLPTGVNLDLLWPPLPLPGKSLPENKTKKKQKLHVSALYHFWKSSHT